MGVIHWVVQYAVHDVLVGTCVCRVTVEDFTDAVHACGFVVSRPEVLLDVFHCVDTEAVDWVFVSMADELDCRVEVLLE